MTLLLCDIFEKYLCMTISLISVCGWSGCGRGGGSTLLQDDTDKDDKNQKTLMYIHNTVTHQQVYY